MKKRGGFFGGKSGTWLRKRKISDATMSYQVNQNGCHDDDPRKSKLRVTLGWDDVRCRPIYQGTGSSPCTTASASSDETECNQPPVQSGEGKKVEQQLAEGEVEANLSSKVDNNNRSDALSRRRLRRSRFGASTRSRIDMMELHLIVHSCSVPTNVQTDSSKKELAASLPDTILETCQENVSGLIAENVLADTGSLDPKQPATTAHDKESPNGTTNNHHDLEFRAEAANDQNHDQSSISKLRSLSSSRSPRQPAAHSSLRKARAFFAQLDANQPLHLQEAGPTPQMKAHVVRTRRRVPLGGALDAEYQLYSDACRQGNITPLPKQEFSQQRGAYFRTDSLYDGFLDE